jgi:hypothetical protein
VLVALDAAAAVEGLGDDRGEEVTTVTLDLEMTAVEAGSDEISHVVGRGLAHGLPF